MTPAVQDQACVSMPASHGDRAHMCMCTAACRAVTCRIMGHDIIGDIHGHADRLEALLGKLGYSVRSGAWRHPSRTAIFVGDFIDRGPGQLRTLELVRAMLEAGSARATMGNHEFNAIAWATPDPQHEGQHLRVRHGEKGAENRRQRAAFLAEIGLDSEAHRAWAAWFMELPLWIEEPTFRVIHACWSPRHVEMLEPHLRSGNRLTAEVVVAASRRGSALYDAVETLLKGVEVELPNGHSFTDKDGRRRHEIRTRWWNPELTTFRSAYIGPSGVEIPDTPIPEHDRLPEPDRPTFIGHYWFDPGEPMAPASRRVVCVDYSVGRGGPLAAYRFDGEAELSAEKFVSA